MIPNQNLPVRVGLRDEVMDVTIISVTGNELILKAGKNHDE